MNGLVFALDGLLIGAGDMRYLAGAMGIALAAFAPAALAVAVWGLSIQWLWAALALLMGVRLLVLALRWRTDRWIVLGARP